MYNKIQTCLLFLLIITTHSALGKSNKITSYKANSKKLNSLKLNITNERSKRSIGNDGEIPFWSNRGKKRIDDYANNDFKYGDGMGLEKSYYKLDKDEPFWGNRGRRDSSLEESYEYENPEFFLKHCKHCVEVPIKPDDIKNTKDRREPSLPPFWGNRGKKKSLEDQDIIDPFWGNSDRRIENESFRGNRGRREDEPFWGNRGRRDDIEPFWGNRGRRDNEPFWGNRGKKQDSDPFWGNRGRREDEPFWGNRGRRKDSEINWPRNRKDKIKYSILNAINDVENDIDKHSRLKKNDNLSSFWANRRRDNKLSLLFNAPSRTRALLQKSEIKPFRRPTFEPGTVLDNRMYVDEPNFILVERFGRSSDEVDPFYISRGKKYYLNYSLEQANRDRRGAIEEIVKSMRNDPYYIARGKKDIGEQNGKATLVKEEYTKAKDLICAVIDLINIEKDKDGNRVKREISENERNRRNTLMKLAAQLQVDPYFVSRGKKSDVINYHDYLQEFVSNVSEKCN